MARETSPTARALLALEVIQNNPGITAQRLGDQLGVTERAARRYIGILREAGMPIESETGPHGGYRVGRGLRLAPLMFSPAEAMGLVMAVLEGHRGAADPTDLVGGALGKILRVLPQRVAGAVGAVRSGGGAAPAGPGPVSLDVANRLIEACIAQRRLRLTYRRCDAEHSMDVDPWAVVLRHSRWYLLAWSHSRQDRRVLRVDRIVGLQSLPESFTPPADLDPLRTLEEHLSQGWTHPVEVLFDAEPEETARWLPRKLGRLEPDGHGGTLLRASTDEPEWYARHLAACPIRFRVMGSAEIQRAVATLGERLMKAADLG